MEIVMGAFEMGDTDKERDYEQFDLYCSLPVINTFFLCKLIPYANDDPCLHLRASGHIQKPMHL